MTNKETEVVTETPEVQEKELMENSETEIEITQEVEEVAEESNGEGEEEMDEGTPQKEEVKEEWLTIMEEMEELTSNGDRFTLMKLFAPHRATFAWHEQGICREVSRWSVMWTITNDIDGNWKFMLSSRTMFT